MHREIEYTSTSVFEDVLSARDRAETFCLIVRGPLAEKLYGVVPFYERYQQARRLGVRRPILSFGLRSIRNPLFWGLCILADFKARKSTFLCADQVLRAEFDFSL